MRPLLRLRGRAGAGAVRNEPVGTRFADSSAHLAPPRPRTFLPRAQAPKTRPQAFLPCAQASPPCARASCALRARLFCLRASFGVLRASPWCFARKPLLPCARGRKACGRDPEACAQGKSLRGWQPVAPCGVSSATEDAGRQTAVAPRAGGRPPGRVHDGWRSPRAGAGPCPVIGHDSISAMRFSWLSCRPTASPPKHSNTVTS